jgi:integrase
MFVKHVYDLVGNTPVTQMTKRQFSSVYHELGRKGLRDETRVYIWKLMYRVMQLAHDPLELLPSNPIPRGKKPAIEDHRRTPALLPEDDEQLLGCQAVSIHNRMLYGFLAREGMRRGEALKLQWCDVTAAVLNAFSQKTGKESARMWQHDTHAALVAYKARYCPDAGPADYVFARAQHMSEVFRTALKHAGVFARRPELAMHSRERGERRQIRLHDLRRLFITLAVASDKSDAWIRTRTGHTSSRMIVHYTDLADMHRSRGRVTLVAMHVSIPELLTPLSGQYETAAE